MLQDITSIYKSITISWIFPHEVVKISSRGKFNATLREYHQQKKVSYFFVQHLVRPKIFVTFAHDKAYMFSMSLWHITHSDAAN